MCVPDYRNPDKGHGKKDSMNSKEKKKNSSFLVNGRFLFVQSYVVCNVNYPKKNFQPG